MELRSTAHTPGRTTTERECERQQPDTRGPARGDNEIHAASHPAQQTPQPVFLRIGRDLHCVSTFCVRAPTCTPPSTMGPLSGAPYMGHKLPLAQVGSRGLFRRDKRQTQQLALHGCIFHGKRNSLLWPGKSYRVKRPRRHSSASRGLALYRSYACPLNRLLGSCGS